VWLTVTAPARVDPTIMRVKSTRKVFFISTRTGVQLPNQPEKFTYFTKAHSKAFHQPGKPSSDTHDQIRKITLKTATAKTTTFNRKKFGMCLREKTMIDYVMCTVIPKVIIT
jgi:hypothetical protein